MPQSERPLISVIVPFYNLEETVDYCLGAILQQDYENFEVICVNDGSTDNTDAKLSTYASDPRVRVINQDNSGPSKARNTGIQAAKGEYLTFIDGDDLVSPYYLSALINTINDTGADVAIGRIAFLPANELESAATSWIKPSGAGAYFDRDTAIKRILSQKLGVSGCGKLARAELYNDHFFPEGHFHEDLSAIFDLYKNVNAVAITDQRIYKYVQREGSNMHGHVSLEQKSKDLVIAVNHMTEVCTALGIDPAYIMLYRCLTCLRLHNDGDYFDAKSLQRYVRDNLHTALSCPDVSRIDRLSLQLFAFSIILYDAVRYIKVKIAPPVG